MGNVLCRRTSTVEPFTASSSPSRMTSQESTVTEGPNTLNESERNVHLCVDSAITPAITECVAATGVVSEPDFKQSSLLPVELFKAAVLQRHRLVDVPHKTSRDADVIVLQSLAKVCRHWKAVFSGSGDLRRRRLKRLFNYNSQLLFIRGKPPTHSDGDPRFVVGVSTLDNHLYVTYYQHNTIEVFECKDRCKRVKDIHVDEMKYPCCMVGCSVTSQLFITENCYSGVIWRVDSKTGVAELLITTGFSGYKSLSLAENRLLVTSHDSLLMLNLLSGDRKKIPLPGDMKGHTVHHSIETNSESFFVSHNRTVSEIDSEGRVIRTLDNKQKLDCDHLALDSVGRLLVADWKNRRIALLDKYLRYERILFDNKRLDDSRPNKLDCNKNNNRLTVGLGAGQVKIYEYNE